MATAAFGVYSIMMEKFAQASERGGVRPSPFIIFTITYKVAAYSPAERADTFIFTPIYAVVVVKKNLRGGGKTVHVVFKYLSRSLL